MLIAKLIFFSVVQGVCIELIAYFLDLWRYRKPSFRVTNVLLVFGCVISSLSWLAITSPWLALVVGSIFGLSYELLNSYRWHSWDFPATTLPWLKGRFADVFIGLGWGLTPLVTYFAYMLI